MANGRRHDQDRRRIGIAKEIAGLHQLFERPEKYLANPQLQIVNPFGRVESRKMGSIDVKPTCELLLDGHVSLPRRIGIELMTSRKGRLDHFLGGINSVRHLLLRQSEKFARLVISFCIRFWYTSIGWSDD